MGSGKRRLLLSALPAGILAAGSLTYGLLFGVPRWSLAFQGALAPTISAYGGWPVSLGIVAVGMVVVGICAAVSWRRGTFHTLIVALGVLSLLVFFSLGLPAPLIVQIKKSLSLAVVGFCGLFVAGVFLFALKDRFTRGRRV